EDLPDGRRGGHAPSVLVKPITGDIPMNAARVETAVFEFGHATAETASTQVDRCALMTAAIFRFDGHRAAERVQTEQRIGTGHQTHVVDRDARNQIPV